jgi:hypothetical protein
MSPQLATNTVGQGDTRATGLAALLRANGTILRAIRRLKWPGEAAVVVAVVHIKKGHVASPVLDDRPVSRISAYLVEGQLDASPARLAINAGKAFIGTYVLGAGFTFDDEAASKGLSSSIADMHSLIQKDRRNAERIFPYIGGEKINNDPTHTHDRYVINFESMTEASARRWPDLMRILEEKVRPQRLKQASIVNPARWWMHARSATDLSKAVTGLSRVIATARVSPSLSFTFLPTGVVYNEKIVVFPFEQYSVFTALQARIHEVWGSRFHFNVEGRSELRAVRLFNQFSFPSDIQHLA